MTTYVCLLAWNRLEKVKRCIESLLPTLYGTKLLVLDQGSTDGTKEYLRRLSLDVRNMTLIDSPQNVGVGMGRQRMVDFLRGRGLQFEDMVVHLDSDVVITDPQWQTRMIGSFAQANVYAVGARGCNIEPGWTGFGPPLPAGPCDVISGAVTMFKGTVFCVGCEYPYAFGRFWHEDSDFSLQIRAKELDVWCCGDIGVHHDAEHKDGDDDYDRNFDLFRQRWQGRGLVAIERKM